MAYTLFTLALISFLSSSSCYYDCDDDHCHDDDHHHHREAETRPLAEAFRLTQYLSEDAYDLSTGELRRTLFEIQGASVFAATGQGTVTESNLQSYTTELLLRNGDQIGVPESGVLTFAGVNDLGPAIEVAYELESSPPGPVANRVTFLFDRMGRLRRIESTRAATAPPLERR